MEKIIREETIRDNHFNPSNLWRNQSVKKIIIDLCDIIEERDPLTNAFLPEPARRNRLLNDLSSLSAKYPQESDRPALYGLPVAVKDIYRVDGFDTLCGSRLPAHLFAGPEASAVTRLKAAGALILGKTVTTEFAWFQPGPTRNPHNPDHTPGGSSSGSAAAVAAGMAPVALGTQTIGSVIRPAAYCGIVGVKPSAHSIPTDGIIPFSPTFDQAGYFTKDLDTAEAIASVMCDEWSSQPAPANVADASQPTEIDHQAQNTLVIGIPDKAFIEQADAEIVNTFQQVVEDLKAAGHCLTTTNLFADIKRINREHKAIAAREFAMVHAEWYSAYAHLYGEQSIKLIQDGREVSEGEVPAILSHRQALQNDVGHRMKQEGIDLWISPAATSLPPKGLTSTGSPLMNLPWTFLGLPCISLPIPNTGLPLPVGLQCSGRMNGLRELIRQARVIEQVLGARHHRS